MEIAVADIGGTHARFAIAELQSGEMRRQLTLPVSDFTGIEDVCSRLPELLGEALPSNAAFAVAAPLRGETVTFPNSGWTFRRETLSRELGLERLLLLNDFEAVAHAVARAAARDFAHIAGPDTALADAGIVSVIGPGTGLGVAMAIREPDGLRVVGTEASHIPFAPRSAIETAIEALLHDRFGRVSVERVVSGPGLAAIWAAIANRNGTTAPAADDAALWDMAQHDADGRAALDIFSLCLSAFAGDVALAHGAHAIVLSGSIVRRLGHRLDEAAWRDRFTDKGRYRAMMETIPVKKLILAEPGLTGALHAYREHFGDIGGS